jgi:hypothetical protein
MAHSLGLTKFGTNISNSYAWMLVSSPAFATFDDQRVILFPHPERWRIMHENILPGLLKASVSCVRQRTARLERWVFDRS